MTADDSRSFASAGLIENAAMEPVTAEHPAAGDDDNFDAHVERVVQRAILRNIPGLNLPQSQSELDVGQTPKELVYSNETARLYHYTPMLDEIYRVPVLIVMSPVAAFRETKSPTWVSQPSCELRKVWAICWPLIDAVAVTRSQ